MLFKKSGGNIINVLYIHLRSKMKPMAKSQSDVSQVLNRKLPVFETQNKDGRTSSGVEHEQGTGIAREGNKSSVVALGPTIILQLTKRH